MKFVIKPASSDFKLIVEAEQYRQMWHTHARPIMRAFREVTGMEFQQRSITAHVYDGRISNAGAFRKPMQLAGDFRSSEKKLMTLVHELAHRLMGGNSLDTIFFKVYDDGPDLEEMIHRQVYLCIYDVVEHGLGPEWLEEYVIYEQKDGWDRSAAHSSAWFWAMNQSFEQRQAALAELRKLVITRDRWEEDNYQAPITEAQKKWLTYITSNP